MEKPRETLLTKGLQHCKERLENYKENRDDSKLLHYLERLYNLPVEIEHLMQTGVGLTVNDLRQVGGEVGIAATNLVTKWKKMVVEEYETEETLLYSSSEEESSNDKAEDGGNLKKEKQRQELDKQDKLHKGRGGDYKKSVKKGSSGERKTKNDAKKKKISTDCFRTRSPSKKISSSLKKSKRTLSSNKLKLRKGRIYDLSSDEEAVKKQVEGKRKPQEEKKAKLGKRHDSKGLPKEHDYCKEEEGGGSKAIGLKNKDESLRNTENKNSVGSSSPGAGFCSIFFVKKF